MIWYLSECSKLKCIRHHSNRTTALHFNLLVLVGDDVGALHSIVKRDSSPCYGSVHTFIHCWMNPKCWPRNFKQREKKKTIDRTRREWVECNESSPFPSVFTGNRIFRTNPKRFWSNERVWNTMLVHHSNPIQNVDAIRWRWVTDQCKCEIPKINQKSTDSNMILNDKILNWHSKCQRVLFRVNILYKICILKCISIQQPFTYVLKWNAVKKINLPQSQLLGWINNSPQSNSHEWHLSIRVWAQYFGHRWMQHQFL